MRILPTLLSTSLLLAAGSATAASFSFDYVEAGFGEVTDLGDADGIYVGGAKTLDHQFGLLGSLGFIDYNAGNGMVLRGGGLFHSPLQPNLELFGSLELVYSDYDANLPFFGNVDDDDIGLAAAAGLRFEVQDNFQLEGKLTVTEVDPFDDGLGLLVGARYFMDKKLSAAAGIASDAEYDGIWINLRYQLK